jgi:hypothetical protein
LDCGHECASVQDGKGSVRESGSQVAQRAKLSAGRLYSFENGWKVTPSTKLALKQVFEGAGIVFYQNDEGDVGVIVKPFTITGL